jgi:sugar phosphate isomerase/epimerase
VTKPFSQHGVQSPSLNVSLPDSFGLEAVSDKSIAPLKLSLSQLTTLRWRLSDELFQLKQTGYDAIGLWRPKVAEFGERHTAAMLEEERISVSSLSFAGGFTGGCGLSYLEAIADGRQAIAQASVLGAKNLIMVGGSQNGHTVRHSRRMVVDGLRILGDVAANANVKLSLLPMHRFFSKRWTFLNSLDHALDILKDVANPHVGLAFDAYQLSEESRVVERIAEIAPLTGIVQLSDGDKVPTSDRERLMPGEGKIPLKEIVQAFQTAGYDGYFDIQVWSGHVWRSNYSHLIEQSHAAVKAMSHRAAVVS